MISADLKHSIRRVDYKISDDDIDYWVQECIEAIARETYDFSLKEKAIFSQNGKKRIIYHYPTKSVENFICHYLKDQIDKVFVLKYASRSKIMNCLFNSITVLKDMHDFVIIRADFKSFFDSLKSRYVYDEFIKESYLHREDKYILKKYVDEFKYCYAGLCLSNGMTEIVCREFDKRLKAKLITYGVFFYERYVDDMLIMLNSYVSENNIIKIINSAINETFGDCPVRLNESSGKFSYISKRGLSGSTSFNFLGYEFFIELSGDKILFEYGITEKKRIRYANIIECAFSQYAINHDEELFRQRLKLFSSRVVIARNLMDRSFDWLTKGIVANYNELHYYINHLHNDTEIFLKELYYNLLKKHQLKRPYFIPKRSDEESMYNLFSNMKRNRALLFEEKIGIPKEVLLKWILKINPDYSDSGKDYYRIVIEYLEMLKVE